MNILSSIFKKITHANQPHGGVHPPEHKKTSTTCPIGAIPIPKQIILPLRQHIGQIPKVLANIGDHVYKGQILALAEGGISASVHASTSGVITAIEERRIPHPSGLPDFCIAIETDGKDEWQKKEMLNWQNESPKTLIEKLQYSGIVGLGGAGFPTQIKLDQSKIQTLIINCAECEPFITCDEMLMRERALAIIEGVSITCYILGVKHCIFGIEDNKPQAISALEKAIQGIPFDMTIQIIPTLYPSGDMRQLIKLLTGKEISRSQHAHNFGIQCFNVATLYALYRFMKFGEPMISRIITVTGSVRHPQNFEALLGTPIVDLLNAVGGNTAPIKEYIMGGPMMGFALPSTEVSVIKAMNCIIAVSEELLPAPPEALPCIRCAKCAEACPVLLQPQDLYSFIKADRLDKAQNIALFDCIECGCCSYVCPSNIPLVQYYRFAKGEILEKERNKTSANIARERHELREERLEQEKQKRAQKHAQRRAGENPEQSSEKKAKIQEALERAKQKAENKEL